MTLPRRVRMTLGAISTVLLFGLLGLAWWWWRQRTGHQRVARFPRTRAVLVALGVIIIMVGASDRLAVALEAVPNCSPPGGALTPPKSGPSELSLVAQTTATSPETGIGLLYAQASGGRVCWSSSASFYVAVNADNIAGTRAMNLGDIVLTPGFNISKEERTTLVAHEARHRPQWAVVTVIAGPFAFPVVYAVDDFFFPGSRNHFERQAGLETGGYTSTGIGPVLGPAQIAVLAVLAAVIAAVLLTAWRRRALARSRRDADTPGDSTDQRTAERLTPEE